MSIVSGTVGAVLGQQAQEKASGDYLRGLRETNDQNRQMYLESRGSEGSAVMPLYLKGLERRIGGDLRDAWGETARPLEDFESAAARYQPMQDAARGTAASIFNGGLESELKGHAAPVQAARVTFTRQAAIDALNKTLADINEAQAGRGYTGDSMGNRLLRFGANRQMANDVAGAQLQNLEENRGIEDAALNQRLNSLDLPSRMAGNELSLLTAGDRAFLDNLTQRLSPLTFLRIGGSQPFQAQAPGMLPPNASAAQLAMQGIGAGGNMALNYWLQNRQQQNYINALKNLRGTSDAAALGSAAADDGWADYAGWALGLTG